MSPTEMLAQVIEFIDTRHSRLEVDQNDVAPEHKDYVEGQIAALEDAQQMIKDMLYEKARRG